MGVPSAVLNSAVTNNGTVSLPYPSDFQISRVDAARAAVVLNENDLVASPLVTFAFGSSSVTVTNKTGASWPARTRIALNAPYLPQADYYTPFTPTSYDETRPTGVDATLFGADPSGATDAGPAIQAAVLAAMAAGLPCVIPAGTYLIKTGILLAVAGDVTILMDRKAVLKADASLADKMLWFQRPYTEANRIFVSGGKFDVSAIPGATNTNYGEVYIGEGYDDVTFRDCWFYSGTDYATGGGDSSFFFVGKRLKMLQCTFQGSVDAAIYISARQDETNGYDALVDGCHFIKCNDGVIAKRQFLRTKVANCSFFQCVTGTVFGEADTSLLPGKFNVISGNTYYKTKGRAIDVRWADYTTVVGNHVMDTGLDLADSGQASSVGIAISGSNYCSVTGNTIVQVTGPGTSGHNGIQIEGKVINGSTVNSTYNAIVGNTVKGYDVGIKEMDSNQVHNVIADNKVNCTTEVTRAGLTTALHTPSAMWLAAATGSYAEVRAVGQSTVGLQYYASGLAGHRFVCSGSTNSPVFEAVPGAASPVNYVQAKSNPTGSAPVLAATGTDTNVGLQLDARGTAPVESLDPFKLPTYTVSTLPSASTFARCLVYVSDGTTNKRFAVSDGTNWRFPDGNIVS